MSSYTKRSSFDDSPFETIFRYNINWTSILVKPIVRVAGSIAFKVKMMDGSLLDLYKNEEGDWEESEIGSTLRSQALGKAIDNYYLL
jgi:hypothetical protein